MTKEEQEIKSTGILNEGENNQFIGNTFNGFDVGIHDKGVDTLVRDNTFIGKKTGPSSGLEIYAKNIKNNGTITSDTTAKIVTENYEGRGEVSVVREGIKKVFWYQRLWGRIIIGVVSGLIVTLVGGFFLHWFGWNK